MCCSVKNHKRRRRPAQQVQPRQAAPAALPAPPPQMEKAANATRLAVFGNSMAVDLAKALERFYADDPNLVVIGQGVGSSGFVRDDYFDWNKTIGEQIAADSFDLAVVIIGVNDRREIKVSGQTYSSLTPAGPRPIRRASTISSANCVPPESP